MDFPFEWVDALFALGGAIGGALITGYFTIRAASKSRDKMEVVVSTSNASDLLFVHDQIAGDVQVTLNGDVVQSVFLSEIFISNTGNAAVKELNVELKPVSKSELMSLHVIDQSTDQTRVGAAVAALGERRTSINLDYINPGEEVALRALASGDSPEWDVLIRQPDLKVIRKEQPVSSISTVLAGVVMEAAVESFPISATLRSAFNERLRKR
ncbi:hypothetical protein ACXN5S_11230 [Pseudoroseicyclus sp. H15]